MAQTLAAVFAVNDRYTATIRKIMQSQDEFQRKQDRIDKATEVFNKRQEQMKKAADKTSTSMGGLAGKLAGLVSVSLLVKKAWDGMAAAIGASALWDVQEKTYQGLLNSEKIGTQLNKYIQVYGKNSLLGQEQAGRAFTAFLPSTRDLNQLEQLEKLTQRLYAKDPTQGQAGAVFAMKELLAGDSLSAKERYNMIGFDNKKIRELNKTGDIEGLITYLDQMFNKFGATEAVVGKMMDTLPAQLGKLKDSFKSAFADTATPVMQTLVGTVQRLNGEMQAGKYQPFINLMVNGMELIGNGIAFVAENAYWLIPAVGGVVTALIAYNTATAIASVVTNSLLGNWGAVILLAGAVTGAAVGMSLAMQDVSDTAKGALTSADAIKNSLAGPLGKTKIDAEIVNADPIKVSGEVDIEQESMKYMLDIAGAKWFAQYSTATLAPQVTVQNMNVSKEVDADSLLDHVADGLATSIEAAPKGACAI